MHLALASVLSLFPTSRCIIGMYVTGFSVEKSQKSLHYFIIFELQTNTMPTTVEGKDNNQNESIFPRLFAPHLISSIISAYELSILFMCIVSRLSFEVLEWEKVCMSVCVLVHALLIKSQAILTLSFILNDERCTAKLCWRPILYHCAYVYSFFSSRFRSLFLFRPFPISKRSQGYLNSCFRTHDNPTGAQIFV